MDPAFAQIVRSFMALVFLVACAHKLHAPRQFLEVVRNYALFPRSFAALVAVPLVAAEFAIGVALLLPQTQRTAMLCGVAMFVLYGAAMSINLLRGRRDMDCGCSGVARDSSLSGWMVLRNALLAAAGVATLAPSHVRALEGLDQFTIAAGAASLYALYAAANLLLAYAPRTRALLG
jgi:uncharacterized membrane protein